MKKTTAFLIVIVSFCACDREGSSTGRDLARTPENASALQKIRKQIVFSVREIAISPTGEGYTGFFVFRNNSPRPVRLPGFAEPPDEMYTASLVEFEVQENENWIRLDIGYCGSRDEFSVAPNTECLLTVDLFAFKEKDTSMVGRVRVGGFTSESFTLDWATDRSEGRFRSARQEYLNEIRKLMRRSGFKKSVTADADFCPRVLLTLLSPIGNNDLGFAPFQGDLDAFPVKSSGGNLRFDFHGSVVVDHEYQYSGMLILNPATFTPAWYRRSVSKHAAVGSWGQARTLKLDDGSGFCTPANKLYLELKYHASPEKTLPDEEASKQLLSRMLSKLGDCLEVGGG